MRHYLEEPAETTSGDTGKISPARSEYFSSIVSPSETHLMTHQTMNLEENELNFLRAKGALLLAQSQQLTAEWNRSEPGMYCFVFNI